MQHAGRTGCSRGGGLAPAAKAPEKRVIEVVLTLPILPRAYGTLMAADSSVCFRPEPSVNCKVSMSDSLGKC